MEPDWVTSEVGGSGPEAAQVAGRVERLDTPCFRVLPERRVGTQHHGVVEGLDSTGSIAEGIEPDTPKLECSETCAGIATVPLAQVVEQSGGIR
jgi:hypothetical protein